MIRIAELRLRGPDGDPIIDLADVMDLNEILIVRSENEWRAHEAAERKARGK